MGREMAAMGHEARIWKENNSILNPDKLTRKADLFVAYIVAVDLKEGTQNQAVVGSQK
jgi:hypothetical protein